MSTMKPRWDWEKEECLRAFHDAVVSCETKVLVAKTIDRQFRPTMNGYREITVPVIDGGMKRPGVITSLKRLYPDEDIDRLLRKFEQTPRQAGRRYGRKNV